MSSPTGFIVIGDGASDRHRSKRWLAARFWLLGQRPWTRGNSICSSGILHFNPHQEIIYKVEHAYLSLTSVRAKITVAESANNAAGAVRESQRCN